MKKVLTSLFVVVILYIVSRGFLGFSGYCPSTGEYFNEEKAVNEAVLAVIREYPPVLRKYESRNGKTVLSMWSPESPIRYIGEEDFFSVNPECCQITSERRNASGEFQGDIGWADKVFGDVYAYVRVEYLVRYIDYLGQEVKLHHVQNLSVSSCSKLINNS